MQCFAHSTIYSFFAGTWYDFSSGYFFSPGIQLNICSILKNLKVDYINVYCINTHTSQTAEDGRGIYQKAHTDTASTLKMQ